MPADPATADDRPDNEPVPRGELHVHLEGTILPQTLLRIARRNGLTLPADTVEGIRELYAFTSFAHFLDVWNLTTNCLRTAEDFAEITLDYAAQAASHGARYVEAIFSPTERVRHGVPLDALFEGYCAGAAQAEVTHGVAVRLTPDLYWSVSADAAEQTARWCVRYADRGIVGLGIGGQEEWAVPETYVRAFDIARDGGVVAVPHIGEVTGPAQVRRVIKALSPHRIRHGITAAKDSDLLALIADLGIGLDVCPTSNVRTRAVPNTDEVPLRALAQAGVAFSVNTDDPAMFGTDLGQEHDIAHDHGISDGELWANVLAINAAEPALAARMADW